MNREQLYDYELQYADKPRTRAEYMHGLNLLKSRVFLAVAENDGPIGVDALATLCGMTNPMHGDPCNAYLVMVRELLDEKLITCKNGELSCNSKNA